MALNCRQALLHMCAGPSEATLTVTGDTTVLPLISPGTCTARVTTFFPVWSGGTPGVAPSR